MSEHAWVVGRSWMVTAEQAALVAEGAHPWQVGGELGVAFTSCLACDVPYAPEVAAQPCPGRGRRLPALAAPVGRNDPCPCGSGRKAKKCTCVARAARDVAEAERLNGSEDRGGSCV